jgi:leader peptidase (prepilin peptidase) / N-methyltransferase
MMLFYWLLVALAVLDAENLWIPDAVTLPGILLGIAWSVLGAEWVGHALERETTLWKDLGERVLAALAAAGLILLIRWIYWLIRHREGIGLGDAKLMAMLGAWLGLSGALLSFGLGVALGSVVALTVLALRKKHDDAAGWALQKLPLGSFLCIGGIASGLWGERIIHAYLRWAGF